MFRAAFLGFVLLTPVRARAADLPAPMDLKPQAIPDPLLMRDGTPVKTAEDWQGRRAPELRALFERYMYGARPVPRPVEGKIVREDKAALGGIATLREIEVRCGLEKPVQLLLVMPNGKAEKAACFLGLNFRGNHQLLDDPGIRIRGSEPVRGKEKDSWCIEQTVKRGYAFASFCYGDVVADEAVAAEADLKAFRNGTGERGPADTAAVMAWAWSFSRMLDYLESVPEIDGHRVAVVGHSRLGKAAMVAAAFDERFALCIPSQAGCGGTSPLRVPAELSKLNEKGRPTVETLPVITRNFPHWFCGNFKEFAGMEDRLPFDQHLLVALCAPRPVLMSCATEDIWSNPDGQYAMLRAAAPAYALLGKPVTLPEGRPAIGALLDERLGYFIRPGKHSMNAEDWAAWLNYADRWLK